MNVPEEFVEESLLIPSLAEEEAGQYDFAHQDVHATLIGMVPVLAEKARHAAKSGLSFSYRGFLVGAAALAYDTDPENNRIGVFAAGNFKAKLREDQRDDTDVEDIPKFCAEMDITMRASMRDFDRIAMFVVAATTKAERIRAVTPLAGATLEPCEECENVMLHSDLVDDRTIIMTMGSGEDIFQIQNFASLRARYDSVRTGASLDDLKRIPYSSIAWEQRQQRYVDARERAGISPNVYERSAEQEKECQDLALTAMMSS
jgi:hypothetical protein